MSSDEFSLRYSDLVTGGYDCVDRIVLNAFYPLGYHPGGLRTWWRRLHGDSDAELDNTHLMRLAGRFARRVKAWGAASGVPVIFCKAGERKHRIAEAYLAQPRGGHGGVFGAGGQGAGAGVEGGALGEHRRDREHRQEARIRQPLFVSHHRSRVGARDDQDVGASAVRRADHPQRHEYVARQAAAAGIAFTKVGNCFTAVADPAGRARIADALSPWAARLRRRRPRSGDKWHFDEVFVTINGTTHYLWRAVDQHGNVLDILVQSRRNAVAAKRFFRQLLKGLRYVPRVIVTDKLASYQVAHRELLPSVTHRRWKYLNNRAENSHQSTRVGERVMKRFAWPGQAQRLLFAFGSIRGHFRPRRHLISAPEWRTEMTNRFAV